MFSARFFLLTLLSLLPLAGTAKAEVEVWHPGSKVSSERIYFAQPVDHIQSGTDIEFGCVLRQKGGEPTTWTWEYFDGRKWVAGRQTSTEYNGYEHNTVFAGSYTLRKAVDDSLRVRFIATKPCTGSMDVMQGSWGKTTFTAYPGLKAKDRTRIGLIGNSFTYYCRTWTMLSQIARSQGHALDMRASLKGGQTFRQHLGLPISRAMLAEGKYDVVILQDQSMQHAIFTSDTTQRSEIMASYKEMAATVKAASPKARIILERTWAYPAKNWMGYGSEDALKGAIINGSEVLAGACGFELSPICEAVAKARSAGIGDLFTKKDDKHNGMSTSYLKACINYLLIFRKPFDANVPDCGLEPDVAAELRRIALETIMPEYAHKGFDKSCYLDIMQTAVEAYTPERIQEYIARVDSAGISEHGYARLTANLGILISNGRMTWRKDLFERMMDICVRETPIANSRNGSRTKVGNDFAVKEICYCLMEIEKAGTFPKAKTDAWRAALSPMVAEDIYTTQPKPGDKAAHNWCVYGAASECARLHAGIGGSQAYADKYLADQLRFFDANGMYMDPHQPMVYDLVTRLQFMSALYFGYNGPAKAAIEENLLKSALPTLQMQSVTGEIPYGGRSNQFLFNETFQAAVCEYYATWMKERGDMAMARRFKAAARRAVESLEYWTDQDPVYHIKNRYPTATKYGCEGYAYFDKYMVTMGSWAYLAWKFADDSIKPAATDEPASTFVMSDKFHRIVMNAHGYTCEFDTDAQKEYDSNGMGRFQKAGAPPVLALASPCPSGSKPNYTLDIKNPGGLAIAPLWDKYSIVRTAPELVELTDGKATWTCSLSEKGLTMVLEGDGEQTLTIPALEFDGESQPEIECDGRTLSVTFNGWRCTWTATDGTIRDTGTTYANRNGHLLRFDASAPGKLTINASIDHL